MSSQGLPDHNGRLFIPQLPYGASGNVHTYDNYNFHENIRIDGNSHVMTDLQVDRNVYIAGNLHIAGNMTEVTLNNTVTDDLIITVGGNNISNNNYRGIEMGYSSGNAFFGYNPSSTVFELYSDIGESIPSDDVFDENNVTKGILKCDIHGNVTGNLFGDVDANSIEIHSGGSIHFNNATETGYAEIIFNETENKLQLQRGLIPSIDSYWDIGNSAKTVGNIYSDFFIGDLVGNIDSNTTVDGYLVVNSTAHVYNDLYLHGNIVFQDGSNSIYGAGTSDIINFYGNTLFVEGGFGCYTDITLTNHPTSLPSGPMTTKIPDGYFYRYDGQFRLMIDDNFYIHPTTLNGDQNDNSSFYFRIDTNGYGHFEAYDVHLTRAIIGGTTYSFTGGHKINESYNTFGMILESTGIVDKTDKLNTIIETRLSNTNKSKKVLGVVDNTNDDMNGVISLGEATMMVTNFGGDIMNGDYICSSEIEGYGMLQDDDILHSYTVAKSTENIDWDSITDTIEHNGQTYKKVLIAVTLHCG